MRIGILTMKEWVFSKHSMSVRPAGQLLILSILTQHKPAVGVMSTLLSTLEPKQKEHFHVWCIKFLSIEENVSSCWSNRKYFCLGFCCCSLLLKMWYNSLQLLSHLLACKRQILCASPLVLHPTHFFWQLDCKTCSQAGQHLDL